MHKGTRKRFTWVFCDLDGTLVDSIPAMYQVYLEFLATFHINGTSAEFSRIDGPSLSELVASLKQQHALAQGLSSLQDLYRGKVVEAYAKYVRPIDGAEQLLRDMSGRGYKLLLTTSASREVAHEFVRGEGWEQYFDQCVFGDEVRLSKPAPDIYDLALKRADADAGDVVAVEDSPNGIRSAKCEGIYVIGLATRHPTEELRCAGADEVARGLGEILSMIEG